MSRSLWSSSMQTHERETQFRLYSSPELEPVHTAIPFLMHQAGFSLVCTLLILLVLCPISEHLLQEHVMANVWMSPQCLMRSEVRLFRSGWCRVCGAGLRMCGDRMSPLTGPAWFWVWRAGKAHPGWEPGQNIRPERSCCL